MLLECSFVVVVIDEIQLSADHDILHMFTDRLLNTCLTEVIVLLGAETIT